jgi:hypothetical protein
LAEKTVDGVAQRVQIVAQEHVAQAHVVLNGLVHEQPGEAGVARARQLIQNPVLFEQTAFAMTRMTPRVPQMALATHRGEYLGVEALSQSGTGATQVAVRKEGGTGPQLFFGRIPGRSPAEGPGRRRELRAPHPALVPGRHGEQRAQLHRRVPRRSRRTSC